MNPMIRLGFWLRITECPICLIPIAEITELPNHCALFRYLTEFGQPCQSPIRIHGVKVLASLTKAAK
jgi:hypothetical protein